MKGKIFTVALLLTSHFGFSQQTYVPDDNFEQALIDAGYDTALDDYVTTDNISDVDALYLIDLGISDLTGIEDFAALTHLRCPDNQLTSLDVSQNTALVYLWCDRNELTGLDVTQNINLQTLWCSENQITSLDVSQNTGLVSLRCDRNQITSLDVTQNSLLEELLCYTNQISSLDFSQNTFLEKLSCSHNPLGTIDVSLNTNLETLNCEENQLTNIDVSQNLALTSLSCGDNQISNLDLSQNTALTALYSSSNDLATLDMSQNIDLERLYCSYNQLTGLDVRNGNNTAITDFHFRANNNPDLFCINVDDAAFSTDTWTDIDEQTVFSENCSGLSAGSLQNPSVQIYPNPASTLITIDYPESIKKVEIYNLLGRLVLQGHGSNTIKVSALSEGSYLMKIHTAKGILLKKIMKI